jgi:RNA polymerase sigma-70 factor (ECF subfamily)
MSTHQLTEDFVAKLTGCQSRLYAYITTLEPRSGAASDILQETNVVLCRRAGEYDTKQDFVGWACRVAYFQVLAHRRDAGRDSQRLIFDDAMVGRLADAAAEQSPGYEQRRSALRLCIDKLPDGQRELLTRRYEHGRSIHDVAESLGRPVGSITQTLHRIRKALLDCVQRTIMAEDRS